MPDGGGERQIQVAHEDPKWRVKAAFRNGRYRRMAEVVAEHDPFPGTSLLWAMSWLLDNGRADELPDLAPVAEISSPMPKRIWRALSRHALGDPEALNLLRREQRLRSEMRAAARVWAVYGEARVDPTLLSRSERAGPPIIQFWDTPDVPEDVERHMNVWSDLAGPLYRRFNAESAADFLSEIHGGAASDTFRNCRHPAIQADYFRLGYLAARGGLWLDADSVMVTHMRWLWPEVTDRLVLMMPNDIPWAFIQNCVMAAPAGNEFMLRAFHEAGRRVTETPGRDVLSLAGPHMLRKVFADMDRDGGVGPVSMLSMRHMRQYLARSADAAYKADNRHWSNLPAPEMPKGAPKKQWWARWRARRDGPRPVVARSMDAELRREFVDVLRADDTTQIAAFAEKYPAHRALALFMGVDLLIVRDQVRRIARLAPLVDPDHWLSFTVWNAIVEHLSGDRKAAANLLAQRAGQGRAPGDAVALWSAFLSAPRFDPPPNPDRTDGPKIIQFWDDTTVPSDVASAMEGWRDLANDNYEKFDAAGARDFLRHTYGAREAEIFDNCGHPAIMSDYFRLGYLAAHGGFYVDADSVAKPEMEWMYPAMAGKTVLWLRTHTPWITVSNGILAAQPGTVFLHKAFEMASHRLTGAPDLTDAVHLAGPGMLRVVMAQLVADGEMDPFHAMPSRLVWNRVFETLAADYKKDDRNWTTWRRNQLAREIRP